MARNGIYLARAREQIAQQRAGNALGKIFERYLIVKAHPSARAGRARRAHRRARLPKAAPRRQDAIGRIADAGGHRRAAETFRLGAEPPDERSRLPAPDAAEQRRELAAENGAVAALSGEVRAADVCEQRLAGEPRERFRAGFGDGAQQHGGAGALGHEAEQL